MLQLWDVRNKKLLHDLPGHADEVYSVDWSPNGEQVASGGPGGQDSHIKMYCSYYLAILRVVP